MNVFANGTHIQQTHRVKGSRERERERERVKNDVTNVHDEV